MTSSNLNERYSALAKRFDDRTQLLWLKSPARDLKHECMRNLMLATRLMGIEQPVEYNTNLIERSWEYTIGNNRMTLAFQAITDASDRQLGGFQFKLLQIGSSAHKVLMAGFDSRSFNGDTGIENRPTAQVSMAQGYQPIAQVHQAIDEQWQHKHVGSLNYRYQRILQQGLR